MNYEGLRQGDDGIIIGKFLQKANFPALVTYTLCLTLL